MLDAKIATAAHSRGKDRDGGENDERILNGGNGAGTESGRDDRRAPPGVQGAPPPWLATLPVTGTPLRAHNAAPTTTTEP
jgi:hypothetical protein